ncbi:MAG: T9SS type A sorting domain-containing protein [Bacteroidales bacterium]
MSGIIKTITNKTMILFLGLFLLNYSAISAISPICHSSPINTGLYKSLISEIPVTDGNTRQGENILMIHDASGYPGDTLVIDVEIINDDVFVGFQFDIPINNGFQFVPGSGVLNPERITDHELSIGILPDTNLLRVLSYSFTNAAYIGNTGIIVSFSLIAPKNTGNYDLIFVDPIIGNVEPANIITQAINSEVSIVPVPLIPYDIFLNDVSVLSGSDTCLAAQHSIVVSSIYIEYGAEVNLLSGYNISVISESKIESGAYFHAFITDDLDYCEKPEVIPAKNIEPYISENSFKHLSYENDAYQIFPNPSSGIFTLRFSEKAPDTDISIKIFNLNGQLIMEKIVSDQVETKFDLSGKPGGIYLIEVITSDSVWINKAVKQ